MAAIVLFSALQSFDLNHYSFHIYFLSISFKNKREYYSRVSRLSVTQLVWTRTRRFIIFLEYR